MHRLKKETVRVPAVLDAQREPLIETVRPPAIVRTSLEGKIAVLVSKNPVPISQLCIDEGKGSEGIDYPSFFTNPGFKADILIFADVLFLWEKMDRFCASLDTFRKANPTSAVIVDASTSPLFRELTKLWEQGKVNAIVDSEPGTQKAIELGIELLSILR